MALGLMTLGVLCLLIAVHPFTTYPFSLWLLRRWLHAPLPKEESRDSELSPASMALCMCAYNEEKVIEGKIENLLALKRANPGLEVLIYVDAASDRTAEILRAYEDEFRLHISPERHGKTHGMNLLVSRVDKPILIFTDANVMIDLDAPKRLVRYFSDPRIGCVTAHLRYTNGDASVTARSGSLYWRLEEWTKRLETDTGSAIGADGSLFALRRSLHRVPPDDIIDDMYVSLMVYCEGYRVVQADDVICYEESVTAPTAEFWRKVRIASCAFNVHRVLWPRMKELDAISVYKYVSHKWIRWQTIFFLTAGITLFEVGLLANGDAEAALWSSGLWAAGLAAGALASSGPLAQAWDILCAFTATGVGVLRSVRGERMKTWTPPARTASK